MTKKRGPKKFDAETNLFSIIKSGKVLVANSGSFVVTKQVLINFDKGKQIWSWSRQAYQKLNLSGKF